MEISLKYICVLDKIIFIAALFWIDNFWPYKKHTHLLANRIRFLIRNVSLEKLEVQLVEI